MPDLLNKDEYTVNYDKLISDGKHPIDVTVVNIESGQGFIKRGTVLSHVIVQAVEAQEANGQNPEVEAVEAFDGFRVLGTGKTDAKYIVAEDVDTTATSGSNVPVTVYKSGGFNAKALIAEPNYTIPTSVYETLRTVGIYID